MRKKRKYMKTPADNERFHTTAALFPAILYLIACKPIINVTFTASNLFKESNHAKQK